MEDVLKDIDNPLHFNEIISAVKEEFDIDLKIIDSLSSALTKYDRKEKRYVRVGS